MPRSDFNPEKEPTPERKWWNIFERQTEFEESEKEKQPEKQAERAKQLKSAAKERGHFWESFIPHREENDGIEEIAPKGEKVRKKWRALLRRKSEVQVEEFRQIHPETVDSYWLAQLMVAERILTLHDQLEQSDPKTNERKNIKTELDVMGLLSEKLSDPDVEVPKEIEDTYRVIVEVIAHGDTDLVIDDLPQIVSEQLEKVQEGTSPERSQSFERFGLAVIVALKHAVEAKDTREVLDEPEVPPAEVLYGGGAPGQTVGTSDTHPVAQSPNLPHGVPSPDSIHSETPANSPPLASLVALTAMVTRQENQERTQPSEPSSYSSVTVPLSPEAAARPDSTRHVLPEKATEVDIPRPSPEAHTLNATPSGEGQYAGTVIEHGGPLKKFDHMTTLELLAIAQHVSVGNGQYLARAYQDGKIDREGLIAILKSVGRKGNYQSEFRQRSAEYIASHPSITRPILEVTPLTKDPLTVVDDNFTEPIGDKPVENTHPYFKKQREAIIKTDRQHTVRQTIIIIVVATVIVVTLWIILPLARSMP
ncbi:MAG: hypothetical protein ABIQ64_01860 [Candidatus Saccharimonadales bacterium]